MEVKISDIKVDKRFRRDFGDLEELADSIKRNGLLHPIIVTEDLQLVAGERRLRAHQLLGRETIEVKILSELDELEQKEIELEENIARKQFTWIEEVEAKAEIHRIKQEKYGKAVKGQDTGKWGIKQTAEALGQSIGSVGMDLQLAKALDEFPELKLEKNKTTAYKKYQRMKEQAILEELAKRQKQSGLARPDVILGDCVEVLKGMESESIDMVFADPPFAIELFDKLGDSEKYGLDYEDDPKEILEMYQACFKELYRVLKNDTHCYVFYGIQYYSLVKFYLEQAGFEVDPLPIIWNKIYGGAASTIQYRYANAYEPCFHAWKGKRPLAEGKPSNVITVPRVPPNERIHHAQKPLELVTYFIEQSSLPGELILDPFGGSGSTGVAAYRAGRRAILIEKNEKTYARIVDRLNEELGGES